LSLEGNRRGWAVLGVAGIGWTAGVLVWLVGGANGLGEAGAVVLLAATTVATVGLALFPGAPPHASGRARTVVDGLIVSGSALFAAWVLGLDGLYANGGGSHRPLSLVVAVAVLTLASAAVVMLTRARPAVRPQLALLAGALCAVAVAIAAIAYLSIGGGFGPSALLAVGLPLGWALAVLAARRSRAAPPWEEIEPGLPTRASVFVPSVPFGLAVVCAAVAGARGDFHGFLIWCGAAVILLIILRQVLALWENISFWRRLESKVEARTGQLRASEKRFRSLVQNTSDVIAVVDRDGALTYLSPSARTVFGYSLSEISRAGRPSELICDEDLLRILAVGRRLASQPGATRAVEGRIRHRDGRLRDVEAVVTNLRDDPAVSGFVINARDITERKELERQLTHRAFHDPLTELANRALFGNRLEHALSRERHPDSLAVLFLDLDDFKNVNDSLGHQSGDELLATVSRRLVDAARSGDTVARLGGDEFAILLEDVDGALEAGRIAARVLAAFDRPLPVGSRDLHIRASIGIATNSGPDETAEALLANADVAMYAAKARGKGRFEHFEHGMHAALVEELELEQALRGAVERGELFLEYQPVVSLASGAVPAVEALVRWRHPTRGVIPPLEFIGTAERTGLIIPVGRWILGEACRQAARWRRQLDGAHSLTMMVNLSVKQLGDPRLLGDVEEALRRSILDPGALLLEITESVVVEDEATVGTMKDIRAHGVRIGIDHFGTKYSSLSYLRRLPIDMVKIANEFVRDLGGDGPEAALTRAIVEMSRNMGLTPIAEGVETRAQAEELGRLGCRLAQGDLFGRPGPPSRIAELIADGENVPLLERDEADSPAVKKRS
jgi:diguanylate cyclase (GGDEF)-like protein/PAS domain S-box-containing protein